MGTGNRPFAVARCGQLQGELKIITAILEQPVIEKILTRVRLQAGASAPPKRSGSSAGGAPVAENPARLARAVGASVQVQRPLNAGGTVLCAQRVFFN